MFKNRDYDMLGWLGIVLIILAYGANTLQFVGADNISYQVANGVGALFLMIDEYHHKDYAPAAGNIIWLIIALIGIARGLL